MHRRTSRWLCWLKGEEEQNTDLQLREKICKSKSMNIGVVKTLDYKKKIKIILKVTYCMTKIFIKWKKSNISGFVVVAQLVEQIKCKEKERNQA